MKKLGFITLACATMFLLAGCGGVSYSALEKELTDKASKYYEANMKNVIFTSNPNRHLITLQALEDAKVDIKNFTDQKCDKTSYAVVIVALDKDGKPVNNYKVENHLTCGSYKTQNK